MKKTVLWLTAFFTAALFLSGCGLIDKANGILLYGDEEKVLASMKEDHKGQVEKKYLPIKMMETESKRILVLNESAAQFLMDMDLLREVVDGKDTEAVPELTESSDGEGLLLAKNEDSELDLDAFGIKTKYEGNIIIGDGRAYADMFLIVTDHDFKEMDGDEKTIGIIQYDGDPDGIGGFDVEREQLVKIEE